MAAFLDQVQARHGGVRRWLSGHGFAADDSRALRSWLLAA